YEIPQPSFDLARHRTNAPPDLNDFGAFYENGQLVVDGQNRPWIVYRHFYVPWIGIVLAHHKQENMRIYARCLLPDGWSKLYSFKRRSGGSTPPLPRPTQPARHRSRLARCPNHPPQNQRPPRRRLC